MNISSWAFISPQMTKSMHKMNKNNPNYFSQLFAANDDIDIKNEAMDSSNEDESSVNDASFSSMISSVTDSVNHHKDVEQQQPYPQEQLAKRRYLIVGGGWGGWGAAKALCESGLDAEVILLDALPDPTGRTPYRSKTGKPVEAGVRGFWKDYPNIYHLCQDELGLLEQDIFTPYTNSSFYSPDGLEATAPVFSETTFSTLLPNIPLPFGQPSIQKLLESQTFPMLPSPLGQVVATSQLFERIPLQDRASMIGLLVATVDCLGGNEDVQAKYDRMTAHELFLRFGLSERLVQDFIRPTLLVGLFKPPEELSALVVMELLYYYALAHQDSFDVRWIRNGTVSDSLIAPLADRLQSQYDLSVMGGCRVGTISLSDTAATTVASSDAENDNKNRNNSKLLQLSSVEYTSMSTGEKHVLHDLDGVILALGCRGMESVVRASPDLAKIPVFSAAASLQGIDVMSVRLWLDRKIHTRTPANVLSRFAELRGAGGTFFMLDQLQENNPNLWGDYDDKDVNDDAPRSNNDARGSVVACDFYNAGALLSLSDDDIVQLLMKDLLPSAVPAFANAKVVDVWVGRYSNSVSWFSPGSFAKRPPLEGAGQSILPMVKCAGDWVRMGEREHGAKGLCQERAYVSGLEAANALLRDTTAKGETYTPAKVLPIREDEIQFQTAVALNQKVMEYVPRFWVR
jgi:uncharacterized protein with NAD-binding domain and iron-sulfur cluster